MKKLLRILFVMCALTFIITVTACRTTELLGITEPNPEPIDGNQQPVEQQVVELESFIMTLPTDDTGITVDETEDVVKVTIKPSLLTYVAGAVTHRAPIFTVTFKNQEKGLIIPAHDLTNIVLYQYRMTRSGTADHHIPNLFSFESHKWAEYRYLTDPNTPGFMSLANNPGWRKAGNQVNSIKNERAFLMCETTVTGINERSYGSDAPAVDDDLAFGDDTKTECFLNLETTGGTGTVVLKKAAREAWAAKVIELNKADPDTDKNLHSVSFLGIATGDAKASDISKLVPTFIRKGIEIGPSEQTKPADIKKLTDVYKNNVLKVEIVIAEEK